VDGSKETAFCIFAFVFQFIEDELRIVLGFIDLFRCPLFQEKDSFIAGTKYLQFID
jgi:hypothetical protein